MPCAIDTIPGRGGTSAQGEKGEGDRGFGIAQRRRGAEVGTEEARVKKGRFGGGNGDKPRDFLLCASAPLRDANVPHSSLFDAGEEGKALGLTQRRGGAER